MTFVGLHMHSDYSLLDGASQLPNLVDRAVELGMPAIALTDHGVMYGAIELIKVCRSRNVKPIIGNEMYVINGDFTQQKRYQKFHQVILAKNTQGYKNLVKLTTVSHLEGFQGRGIFARPCINKEYIEKYKEGLIVTSGCLGGEVPQAIMAGRPDAARKVAKWYQNVFGEDYYLELQDHGSKEDRVVNVEIVRIARELNIKLIATNDSHFVSCFDVEAHDALLCIQTGQLIREDKRMRYSGTEYLKSKEEMACLFRDHLSDDVIAEAIDNTLEVAAKIKSYDILGEPKIPDFPIPIGHTPATFVEEISREGLKERLRVKNYLDISTEYQERLDYELKMIERMGFSTYFLVVWDYIKFARDRQIPVGPGRGSAAGSLVAYAMKITNIDPVHHCLLFERFLNPERKSMPDIDTDFCIERRSEVIEYVTEKYGKERVAQIITFNRMTSKAVLKDVARVLNIPYGAANELGKLIPVVRGKPTKLKVMISDKTPSPEFKEAYENAIYIDPETGAEITGKQWIDMAMRIEGTNKTFGVHAAGVVISAQPLDEIVPLQRNNDGSVITQYYMEDLDSMGLLKMDFLGLRNLTIIQNAIDLIEQTKGIKIDPDEITNEERQTYKILGKGSVKKRPMDVERTYKRIEAGDLDGVFQLESSGMLDVVEQLKPSSIEDLSSILALYRPGPLDAGLIPIFINRKHGREEVTYDHPLLEPILNETYGTLCLPKGTLIDRPNGKSTPIENIQANDLIITSNGQENRSAKVAKQWRSGIKEILKITLSSGTVIHTSTQHRFLTPEGDLRAEELKPALTGIKNAHIHASAVYEKWATSGNCHQLSKNEAYLVGLFIGDGNLVSSTPNIACGEEETAKWVSQLISQTWGGEAKHYFHTRAWYAYCKFNTAPNPTPFTLFMDRIYGSRGWKVRSKSKHLPTNILDYCESDRTDLLRGLWDADGCYAPYVVYYRSISPQLLQDVGLLLSSLKIAYSISDNYVYIIDRTRFKQIIGKSILPCKQDVGIVNNYMPILAEEFAELLSPAMAITDSFTRKAAKKALGTSTFFKPTDSVYKDKLIDWDILYDRIYSKTYLQDSRPVYVIDVECAGEAECFDLEMEDQSSPYFLAHGVVVHNCYQEQIMRMAQDLAGYSLGQADLLRRAMGKKKADEMQKQRQTFLDGSAKNGITVEIATKLFDQMVQFAEYCFNKSHSTAYAYVTYQTAFLKANYPAEYMSALLTANSGDQDKITRYLNNCEQTLQIKVEPPDINRSNVKFRPVINAEHPSRLNILFGLSAIKNVGEGAIDNILAARLEGGNFTSLADLCQRVSLQAVNKRALECLIQCGTFDSIDRNRKQLINDLDVIIPWSQSKAKEKAIGQGNLFDLLGDSKPESGGFEAVPKSKLVDDFPSQERLQFELELLGVYVSDHPLKEAEKIAKWQKITCVRLGEIEEPTKEVTVVVLLTEVKVVQTKKDNKSMAILKLTDIAGGKMEGVIFPEAYEKVKDLLFPNAPAILVGKVNRKDEELQLIVNEAIAIDPNSKYKEGAVEIESEYLVLIELPLNMANDEIKTQELKTILSEYSGDTSATKTPVYAIVRGEHDYQLVRFGKQFWIQDPTMLTDRMEQRGFHLQVKSLEPNSDNIE